LQRRSPRRRIWEEAHLPEKLTVHDPRGHPPTLPDRSLAPRIDGLDGRMVYLVDCLFDNGDVFMEQLAGWFREHLPAVETRVIRPRGDEIDPETYARVAEDGDAAILGVGI
jgi:hypothetical protein